MSKIHKISFSAIIVSLFFSIVLGVVTRNSYKYPDRDEGVILLDSEYSEEQIESLNAQWLIGKLEKNECVFVVSIKSSENIHESTKVVAVVEKTIKGNEEIGEEIIIHEPNFFRYNKNSDELSYFCVNWVNNLMSVGKQYLVFVNKVEFSNAYQQTLLRNEYVVPVSQSLYSFPINDTIKYMNFDGVQKYNSVKDYNYFCYSEANAEKLNEIKNEVLEYFLE